MIDFSEIQKKAGNAKTKTQEEPRRLEETSISRLNKDNPNVIGEIDAPAAKQIKIKKAANGSYNLYELLDFDVDEEELENAKTFEEKKKALGF